jgi:hypothetical protein
LGDPSMLVSFNLIDSTQTCLNFARFGEVLFQHLSFSAMFVRLGLCEQN